MLQEDFNLMLNNAQTYNRPDSRIHRDAVTIQAAVQAAVTQLEQQEHKTPTTGKSTPKPGKVVAQASVPQVCGRGSYCVTVHCCYFTFAIYLIIFLHVI